MNSLIKALDKTHNYNKYYKIQDDNINKIINKSNISFSILFNSDNFNYIKNYKKNHKLSEKIIINTKINSIADLLYIIDYYPYYKNIEYNIDLKALHNIKIPLIKLKNMVGLESIKISIVDQILFYLQKLHINKKTNENNDFLHTVLYGKPGTGKTEVAMIIGEIFCKLGILKNHKFKKVTRKDLIGGYLGQTAILTNDIIKETLGGVLFIDEVYSLGNKENKDTYSKECIDTLCEALSFHKNELMVIIAGYEDDIKECFFNYNPGLESRFSWKYKIDPYNYNELANIFNNKIEEIGWELKEKLNIDFFKNNYDEFIYYGRDMEILLAKVKIIHSKRIFGLSEDEKMKITAEDIENGFKIYLENNKNNKKSLLDNYVLNTIYT